MAVLPFLLMATAGCDELEQNPRMAEACRSIGLCDEPVPPPVAIDVLCDASLGSSCNTETLRRTLAVTLRHAALRPGSRVRLWMLGKDVASTTAVGEQVSPAFLRGSARSRRAAGERFIAGATEFFLAAAAHVLEAPGVRRSPLAEALSKISLADAGGLPRRIVAVTDGREVSGLGDLECARLPAKEAFLAVLRRAHVLGPGLLTGASVEFVFVEFTPIQGRGCAAGVDRELHVRELWTAALKGAGAREVRIGSGPPTLGEEPAVMAEKQGGGVVP
jgi:hypothetical protein